MRIQSVRQVQVMALDCWLCLLDLCMPQLIDRKRETWKLLLDINTIATSLATVATQWPSINYVKLDGFFCTCGPCNPSNIWTFAKSLTPDGHLQQPNFSNGLTKLAILPDYELPGMLCLALPARRKVWKLDFQSEFSM